MALVATELAEVVPPAPYFAATIADRYVVTTDYREDNAAAPGNVPRGSVAVMDANTGVATGYKGLNFSNKLAAGGGYAWIATSAAHAASSTSSVRTLIRLHPSGANANFLIPGLGNLSNVVSVNNQEIWLLSNNSKTDTNIQRFDIGTMTWLAAHSFSYVTFSAQWDGGNYVYAFTNEPKVRRIHISTGATSDVTPVGYASPSGVVANWHPGTSSFYWMVFGVVHKYTPSTGAFASVNTGWGNNAHCFSGFVEADDGLLYCAQWAADRLVIIDPTTMSVGSENLSPSRAMRSATGYANGKLWIAAGAPYSR